MVVRLALENAASAATLLLLSEATLTEVKEEAAAGRHRYLIDCQEGTVNLITFAGSSNPSLANRIAEELGVGLGQRMIGRTPDGELQVDLKTNVRACDVFLVQSTGLPADRNLMELFFLADASRRAGASHVTAVTPYFGYARQDSNGHGRGALGGRLIADLLRSSGVGRVIAIDLHNRSFESAFGIALEHLSCANLFLSAISDQTRDSVVLAPDMGAFRLAEYYASALNLPLAIVAKTRVSGEEVIAQSLIGDVRGKRLIVVDDMIITGATVEAAIKKAIAAGAIPEATVVATHGVLVESALNHLAALPVKRYLLSDSLELPFETTLPIQRVSLAPLLAKVIRRLHGGEQLDDW